MQNAFKFTGTESTNYLIDERTKAVGRQGIAAARRALENCRPADSDVLAA